VTDIRKPEPIPPNLWLELVQSGYQIHLDAGELLWTPGRPRLKATYIVVSGLMRLYYPTDKGSAVTILAIGSGGLLGYHPERRRSSYITGAEALFDTLLLSVSAEQVKAWLNGQAENQAAFAEWMIRDMDLHLVDTYTRLELEHTSARERVARVLLALDRQGILPFATRQQIAELANLTTETVVRTLSQLKREGVLTTTRFVQLSADEQQRLGELLAPFEPLTLPYS